MHGLNGYEHKEKQIMKNSTIPMDYQKETKDNTGRILTLGIGLCCLSLGTSLTLWLRPDKAINQLLNDLQSRFEATVEKETEIISELPEETVSALLSEIPSLPASSIEGNVEAPDTAVDTLQDDQIYDHITTSSLGPLIYYSQCDTRWKDYLYGGSDPIEQYGCGPTTIAMLVSSFTDEPLTPPEAADWAAANGLHSAGNGSLHSLIPTALSAYGFTVESVKDRSVEHVSSLLEQGNILVALMGRGTFTDNGHFLLITERVDDQTVRIADPNSYENSTKNWQLSQLLSELKHNYDSGAPLWAVSLP